MSICIEYAGTIYFCGGCAKHPEYAMIGYIDCLFVTKNNNNAYHENRWWWVLLTSMLNVPRMSQEKENENNNILSNFPKGPRISWIPNHRRKPTFPTLRRRIYRGKFPTRVGLNVFEQHQRAEWRHRLIIFQFLPCVRRK